jgi:hypothetical protein
MSSASVDLLVEGVADRRRSISECRVAIGNAEKIIEDNEREIATFTKEIDDLTQSINKLEVR